METVTTLSGCSNIQLLRPDADTCILMASYNQYSLTLSLNAVLSYDAYSRFTWNTGYPLAVATNVSLSGTVLTASLPSTQTSGVTYSDAIDLNLTIVVQGGSGQFNLAVVAPADVSTATNDVEIIQSPGGLLLQASKNGVVWSFDLGSQLGYDDEGRFSWKMEHSIGEAEEPALSGAILKASLPVQSGGVSQDGLDLSRYISVAGQGGSGPDGYHFVLTKSPKA